MIKVIEDTVRQNEGFSNVFSSKVLFVIMVQAEFSPVKCFLLSAPYPINCPCQMPSYEFKIYLKNIKYFLLKGNLDSRSNLSIYSSLIFVTVQQSGMPSALHRL